MFVFRGPILNCIKRATNQAPIVIFTDADPSLKQITQRLSNDKRLSYTTARVEGYNWIIKQQLKANSTLCEIVDRLDSRLNDEKQWAL
ncbi:unnamed protein product [Rhizophagus irregularis]|nr:unnamed protein product [Rhizophagus irregularis]